MTVDALRFDGEVFGPSGEHLGEARFWGSAERGTEGGTWRGWLRVTDLERVDLPRGRYRVRAFAGWEVEFEPLVARSQRVFESDLLPVLGVGDPGWPDAAEEPAPRYRPLWDAAPPRGARDTGRLGDLPPLTIEARTTLPRPDEEREPPVEVV